MLRPRRPATAVSGIQAMLRLARVGTACRVAFAAPRKRRAVDLLRDFFGRFLYSFSLIRASSTQNVRQSIISFATRVFK